MQRNIGETFDYNGQSLQVVKTPNLSCKGCYFENFPGFCCSRANITGVCSSIHRIDGNSIIFKQMEDNQKEIKIQVPDGYEIDKQKSSFEKIVFKKIDPSWRNNHRNGVDGYTINFDKRVAWAASSSNKDHFIFETEKQAASALAMARISQIIANDERFGGPITDEEWKNSKIDKFVIYCSCCSDRRRIDFFVTDCMYHFLAFHTEEQRNLFLKENEDLVRDYLMV